MIEQLIGLSISSIWIVIGGLSLLFLLRILAVVLAKTDAKNALYVLFMPFSVGYFRSFPERTWLKTVYRIVVAIVFFFSLLAAFWVIYTHFA
ncbi:MAG: hypothetical protein Q8N15_07225 [Bacillota bacterium]|nr:hypothetical protein [Bacillota bacterium]